MDVVTSDGNVAQDKPKILVYNLPPNTVSHTSKEARKVSLLIFFVVMF